MRAGIVMRPQLFRNAAGVQEFNIFQDLDGGVWRRAEIDSMTRVKPPPSAQNSRKAANRLIFMCITPEYSNKPALHKAIARPMMRQTRHERRNPPAALASGIFR